MGIADVTPDISIVTPCLNRVAYIETAIQSVLSQGIVNYEHIIVDGGSTDGTLDIIKKYPHVRYISEKDENLYEALNKAIRMARGQVIGHLNSDDKYPENTFNLVLAEFKNDASLDTVYGDVKIYETHDGVRTLVNHYENTELSLENITVGVASTNARFFSKRTYDSIGLYSEKYRIAADREFLLRAALADLKSTRIPQTIYEYLSHPDSITISNSNKATKKTAGEYIDIAETYLEMKCEIGLRKWLKKWVSQTSITMLIVSLKEFDLGSAWFYFLKGTNNNIAFPFTFVKHVVVGKFQRLVGLARVES